MNNYTLPPLCVDLDGTLIASDTLWESVLVLLRLNPLLLFLMPVWLLRGKAFFKQKIAQRAQLDTVYLPYRAELIDFLREEKAKGRYIVLATAANDQIAEGVASHLALFDEIYASDVSQNLKGERKCAALKRRFGQFDYIGDAHADLPILQAAQTGYLVNPTRKLRQVYPCPDEQVFLVRSDSCIKAWLKALRPHQWAKNALILVPLLLSMQLLEWDKTLAALLAVMTFSLTASAGYLINDLLDLAADRAHKTKQKRPFAAGILPVQHGLPVFIGLIVLSFALSFCCLPLEFSAILLVYLIMTLFYSFYLKQKLILDVLVLAGLYTLRILAGAMAISIPISPWLLTFSIFLFTSLAFLKRYIELLDLDLEKQQFGIKNRDYWKGDAELISSMGSSSGYLAVLVFALYIEEIKSNTTLYLRPDYQTPEMLWLICPALLYWVTRMWFIAHRQNMHDDPVKFAITDKVSWLVFAYTAIIMLVAVYI